MEMESLNDVHVFVTGTKKPVVTTNRLVLSNASTMMEDILKGLTLCDGCPGPLSFIIADEEERVVTAAFSKVTRKRGGLTIIQGRYLDVIYIV